MIQLDQPIQSEIVKSFAAQAAVLRPDLRHILEESFDNSKSDDFYAGLLAGLAAAYQFRTLPPEPDVLPAAIAVTAVIVDNRTTSKT